MNCRHLFFYTCGTQRASNLAPPSCMSTNEQERQILHPKGPSAIFSEEITLRNRRFFCLVRRLELSLYQNTLNNMNMWMQSNQHERFLVAFVSHKNRKTSSPLKIAGHVYHDQQQPILFSFLPYFFFFYSNKRTQYPSESDNK